MLFQGCIDSPFRSHFPVFDKGLFIGLFSEEDIQTFESESTKLSHYKDLLQTFSATQNTALLDLIKLFATHDTNIIPIVNEDMYYQGYYDLKDILSVFASTPFLAAEHDSVLLESLATDFSMSKIAHLVEATGGQLLGCYVSERKNDKIQATLKIECQDINEVIQTFRRYDFTVLSNHNSDVYLEDIKNRSEYLQKYLEMS